MNAPGRWMAGLLGIAAVVLIAVASAWAEDDEASAPSPPPAPLVLRWYGVAGILETEPDRPGVITIAPEKGLPPLATSVWEDDRLPRTLMPYDPPKPDAADGVVALCGGYPGEWLEEFLEQRTSEDGEGSIECVNGLVVVRKSERAHAEIVRLLETIAATCRKVSLEARVVLLPSSDPALLSVRAGALEEAAAARGLPLLSERRDVVRSSRTRLVRAQRATIVAGLRLRGREGRLAVDPAIESLPSGVEVEMLAHALLDRHAIRLSVRAAEVTIDRTEYARAAGTDIGLPSRGERSAATTIEVADGRRAAIPLGPHGASGTAVLLIGATIRPLHRDGPRGADVGADHSPAPPAPAPDLQEGTAGHRRNPSAFLDVAPVVYDYDDGGGMSPDVLQELVKGATGGDASWSDGTNMEIRRGSPYMTNTPEVISTSAAIIADLCEQRRPRRLDAWLLRSATVTATAGPIDAAKAEALLESAARQDGPSLVARFGGGLAPRGATYFRSLERTRFVAGVETLSPGPPSSTAAVQVPLVCAADAGVSLEAHLDETGPLPGAGLSMQVALAMQSLDLGRTARLTIGAGESLEARLPSIERREIGGRVTLPAAGGWALFTSGSPARDGAREGNLLLVRVAP